MNDRISKPIYYLEIAQTVSKRSTCLRRRWGAIIVKDDEIISTGYNGAPRGRANCTDLGTCLREEYDIPRGTRYELCRAVHAEANAIIPASHEKMIHATMYIYGYDVGTGSIVAGADSCMMCKRMIINAGIDTVVTADPNGLGYDKDAGYGYRIQRVEDWVNAEEKSPEAGY